MVRARHALADTFGGRSYILSKMVNNNNDNNNNNDKNVKVLLN